MEHVHSTCHWHGSVITFSRCLQRGWTALFWAAAGGHDEAVALLLEHRAAADVRSTVSGISLVLDCEHKGIQFDFRLRN